MWVSRLAGRPAGRAGEWEGTVWYGVAISANVCREGPADLSATSSTRRTGGVFSVGHVRVFCVALWPFVRVGMTNPRSGVCTSYFQQCRCIGPFPKSYKRILLPGHQLRINACIRLDKHQASQHFTSVIQGYFSKHRTIMCKVPANLRREETTLPASKVPYFRDIRMKKLHVLISVQ